MNKIEFAYFMEEYLNEDVNWKSMVSPNQRMELAYQKAAKLRSPAGNKARTKLVIMHMNAEDKRIARAERTGKHTVDPKDYSQY